MVEARCTPRQPEPGATPVCTTLSPAWRSVLPVSVTTRTTFPSCCPLSSVPFSATRTPFLPFNPALILKPAKLLAPLGPFHHRSPFMECPAPGCLSGSLSLRFQFECYLIWRILLQILILVLQAFCHIILYLQILSFLSPAS